ncbi:MAG: NUDIX hydrolase [Proteobacteria bacterium]|nr:NUDIX hydrolase [Pseudomonadota bacterium]
MKDEKTTSPILSATVILGRNGKDGLEVFMVKRNRQIEFASGALVFPGGKVDENDQAQGLRAYCDGQEGLTDRELCLCIAAIREAYEESGIFLARFRGKQEMVSGKDLQRLSVYRNQLAENKISMETFLKTEKLVLACNKLICFAHWITPLQMPKRFDTSFFLAETPNGHMGEHDGLESVDSVWITPEKAIEMADSGKLTMIFPTRMNMLKLGKDKTLEDAVLRARSEKIVTIMPRVEDRNGELMLCIPEDAGYPVTSEFLKKVMG